MASRFTSNDDDERERPSWREIDRRRDRSRHVGRGDPGRKQQTSHSAWANQQYLKEADKIFQGPKRGKEHDSALQAIHRAYGTHKFAPAVRKYLKAYGIPSDWGTLMLVLDYRDEKVVEEAIKALKLKAPERSSIERQGLKDKLEILALTANSTGIMSLAEQSAKEL